MGSSLAAMAMSAFAMGAGAPGSTAHASIPPLEVGDAVKSYKIRAGSMADALSAFADANGYHLLYDTRLTQAMRTHGLSGHYSAEKGLGRLLSGTGLAYRFVRNGRDVSIILAQAATGTQSDADAVALPTIDVNAQKAGGTEGAGYSIPDAVSATKTDTPILDTPVAIQVVPRDVINDQQNLTVLQAVQNVSGVQVPPGAFYDGFQLRGFANIRMLFRNGLQLEGLSNSEDIAFIDHIEVVKGPASILYGRLEPGGLVNVVTRGPLDRPYYAVQQQVGSFGLLRTVADATGPLNEDHTLLYRIIGVHDQADSFVDFAHHDNNAVAGFLTWRPTNQFEFNLSLEHYNTKTTSPGGNGPYGGGGEVPVIDNRPANLPRHFTASDPVMWQDFPYKVNRTLVGFNWTAHLNESWKLTQRFHYLTADETQTALAVRTFDGIDTVTTRRFVNNPLTRSIYGTNLDLTGNFGTGPFQHKLLMGLDWYQYMENFKGFIGPALALPPLNIYHPIYGLDSGYLSGLVASARGNTLFKGNSDDFGLYAQDQITFAKDWILVLGGRYDLAKISQSNVYGNIFASCFPVCTGEPKQFLTNSAFSPRFALLYKATDDISLYGSYTKSFGANNGLSATGKTIPPEIASQYEVGAKALLLDGRVTTSLALYNLTKSNVLTPDPLNPDFSIPVGAVRSRGIEFDIAGQITDHVSLIGSYTFDSVKIVADTTGNVGNQFPGTPYNSASLWAKYDTAPGTPVGWTFGLGAYYVGQRQGDNANTYQLPAYDRWDGMVGYRTNVGGFQLTAQLNIQNIFDRAYFTGTNGGTNAYYGPPRSVLGLLKVEF